MANTETSPEVTGEAVGCSILAWYAKKLIAFFCLLPRQPFFFFLTFVFLFLLCLISLSFLPLLDKL